MKDAVEEDWKTPETNKLLLTVDDADEINPLPIVSIPVVEALASVVFPATFKVPVAVIFATLRFPETSALPWTANKAPGEVVPIPKYPLESNLAASVRSPLFNIEK